MFTGALRATLTVRGWRSGDRRTRPNAESNINRNTFSIFHSNLSDLVYLENMYYLVIMFTDVSRVTLTVLGWRSAERQTRPVRMLQ